MPPGNALVREGEYWTVVFNGRTSRLRDAKGLRYLDHLLRHPGEEVHALALVTAADHTPGAPAGAEADGLHHADVSDAGSVLDATAIAAYRHRYEDLSEELADAEACADGERAARARYELDALAEQLSAGLGLGGRHRRAGSSAERARLAVTKAIRATLRKLAEADPALGAHLERSLHTGTFCVYSPDPGLGVVWQDEPAPAPAPVLAPSQPAVGRPLERRTVNELVAAASAGRGGFVLVCGEPGIGKTRLAQEAVAAARGRGMGTLVGRCLETEVAVPWLPLVEVLEQIVSDASDDRLEPLLGAAGSDVAKLMPSLRLRLPDLPPPLDVPPEHARHHLNTSLRDLLLRLSAGRPTLFVVEDVHWADAATLALLEHLADRVADARLLVIVTYRSDEVGLGTLLARTLERLLRHPAVTKLALRPLDDAEVAELVAGVTGRRPPVSLAARLRADTGGNPFFVEELVRHLADEDRLFTTAGEFRTDLETGTTELPESLRLVLGHRLQRLGDACRRMLLVAAVAGRDVDVELLARAGGTAGSEDDVADAVDEALRSGVMVPVGSGRFGFRHALLRQAALAQRTEVAQRRVHLALAEALRRRHGEDPAHAAEIAEHLEAAGPGAERALTLRYLELAASRSLESAVPEDAETRFRRALALVEPDDGGGRARLLAGLGYAQRALGRLDEATETWSTALALLDPSDPSDTPLLVDLCRTLGRFLDATGRLDEALAVVRRGLAAIGPEASEERSQLLSALANGLSLLGSHREAAAALDTADAIARDMSARADVLASRTLLAFTAGRLADCIDTAGEASELLLACGRPWEAVQAQVTTLWPRLWLGRVEDIRNRLAETQPLAEQLRHPAAMFLSARSAALVDLMTTGALDRFAPKAVADVEFCRENNLRWLADAHVFAGLAAFWRGDWDEADEQLAAGARCPTPPVYAGRYTASRLLFTAWSGDADSFDALVATHRSALPRLEADRTIGTIAFSLAEVEGLALLGRSEEAAARYPLVTGMMDEGLILRPPDLRPLAALAGLCAGLGGDQEGARAHFAEARRLVAALPHPREAPEVDFLEALASRTASETEALLHAAADGYRAFGMARHLDLAESRHSTV